MENLKIIAELIEKQAHTKCDNYYNAWLAEVLAVTRFYGDAGLVRKVKADLTAHRPHFFKDYMKKLRGEVSKMNYSSKDRIYLEAYLTCNKNTRAAANHIGIPKSTFHDWVSKNRYLIEAEEGKSQCNH